MPSTDTLFRALADPTRREILELLADRSDGLPITEISAHFKVSRQAVTKHLQVLRRAGLLTVTTEGRERHCTVNLRPLKKIHDWVAVYQRFWDRKLADLGQFLNRKNR